MTKLKDKPFAIIGVHVGGLDVKGLREVMTTSKLPWRSFVDPGNAGAGPIAKKWNQSATPTFYLLDHKAVIRYKWTGPPGEKVLDTAIEKLIEEAQRSERN